MDLSAEEEDLSIHLLADAHARQMRRLAFQQQTLVADRVLGGDGDRASAFVLGRQTAVHDELAVLRGQRLAHAHGVERETHLAIVRGADHGIDDLLLRIGDVRHRVRVDELLLVREELDHRRRELGHGPEGERREASRLRRILQGIGLLFFGWRLRAN